MATTTGFVVPTLTTLIERISSDINTRIPGQDSRIRYSLLWVLARVVAGAVWTVYAFQGWIMGQLMLDTTTELTRRHATIWGVTPNPATKATGNVLVNGTAASVIPAGTVVQTVAGVQYETDVIVNFPTPTAQQTVSVTALAAGDDGNAAASTILTFVSPPAGVVATATVDTGLTGGTDVESDEDLRDRVVDFVRDRPHGGCTQDYETWAMEVAGVERVWVVGEVNTLGLTVPAGDVWVYFATTGVGSAVIPAAPLIAQVQAYLGDDSRRPVTMAVTAKAPTPHVVDITIDLEPNTSAVQAQVEDELEALFLSTATLGGTIYNSQIHEAVSRAAGETSHSFAAVDGGAGTSDVVCSGDELAILGTVTFV
jgi:uncharacterized phage protein gp47/JayE